MLVPKQFRNFLYNYISRPYRFDSNYLHKYYYIYPEPEIEPQTQTPDCEKCLAATIHQLYPEPEIKD